MLSLKFSHIRRELAEKKYRSANQLLSEICYSSLSGCAASLYDALLGEIPLEFRLDDQNSSSKEGWLQCETVSELDGQVIQPGTSIVSCCMNRNENLLKSLTSWLKLPVNEIVIVDWSSSVPVSETIAHVQDERIKVLRVDSEPKWVLTYGFNVGLRFASYSKVFKLDADIEVSEDFIELNSFASDKFVRGYWKSALDSGLDDQVYVNGSFGAYKEHLRQIGYYNELIRTYGWDDSDLYERLSSQCGLGTKYLDFKSVLHLEQKEEDRTANQDVISSSFLGLVPTTEFNNQRNKFIGRTTDYWNLSRLQDYFIEQVTPQYWVLKRATESVHIPQYIIDDANVYATIHFLWGRQSHLIQGAKSQTGFAKLVYEQYRAGVDFNLTLAMLGKVDIPHKLFVYSGEQPLEDFIKSCYVFANNNSMRVIALTGCEVFNYWRLGEHGSYVDLMGMPQYMVDELLHSRKSTGLESVETYNLKRVSESLLKQVFESHYQPKVYVDAQHGLGNRLRAIGSAAAIAKDTNRELVIIWEPDHHCECEFQDLFDYDGKVIDKSFVTEASNFMDVYNYMEIEAGACKDKKVVLFEGRDVYLRAAYTFVHDASHWDAENEFIKSLKPSEQVLGLIEQFDVSGCIAAHIRMEAGKGLDHNTYDSVENWTQEGHDQLQYWREKSHYSHFIKHIDQLFESDSESILFLATDMPETYDVFKSYYGDRLVCLERDVFDRSKEQIKYALADAILLSRSSRLLGSNWSSFSELAMRMSTTYDCIEISGKDF